MDKIQEEIWNWVLEMNRKWTEEKKAEELKNYFHKNMVAITPTDSKIIEGGEKCVAGWKNFADNSVIHFWRELEPKIQVYGEGKFAVVSYYFEMSYDMNGKTTDMKGRDMLALVKENGKWQMVSDQFSPMPKEQV
jgi:hypothetical protein